MHAGLMLRVRRSARRCGRCGFEASPNRPRLCPLWVVGFLESRYNVLRVCSLRSRRRASHSRRDEHRKGRADASCARGLREASNLIRGVPNQKHASGYCIQYQTARAPRALRAARGSPRPPPPAAAPRARVCPSHALRTRPLDRPRPPGHFARRAARTRSLVPPDSGVSFRR